MRSWRAFCCRLAASNDVPIVHFWRIEEYSTTHSHLIELLAYEYFGATRLRPMLLELQHASAAAWSRQR